MHHFLCDLRFTAFYANNCKGLWTLLQPLNHSSYIQPSKKVLKPSCLIVLLGNRDVGSVFYSNLCRHTHEYKIR